jgi:retron-type reverse transcriptase
MPAGRKVLTSAKSVLHDNFNGISARRLLLLQRELENHSFRFKPIQGAYIPKVGGSKRFLAPSFLDRVVQGAACCALKEIHAGRSHDFWSGKSPHTALLQLKEWPGVRWFIRGGISKYFDTINHGALQNQLERVVDDREFIDFCRKVIRARAELVKATAPQGTAGTPQEETVWSLLGNVMLHELDQ